MIEDALYELICSEDYRRDFCANCPMLEDAPRDDYGDVDFDLFDCEPCDDKCKHFKRVKALIDEANVLEAECWELCDNK